MRAKEFINESASAGATGAGAVATVPAALGGMQRRKKKINEDLPPNFPEGYEEISFKSEPAYELAMEKFGDIFVEPNFEQMFIPTKYVSKFEDTMMSHGFDTPEDWELNPSDLMDLEYSDEDIPDHSWSSYKR